VALDQCERSLGQSLGKAVAALYLHASALDWRRRLSKNCRARLEAANALTKTFNVVRVIPLDTRLRCLTTLRFW